jgi:hypothetical protein
MRKPIFVLFLFAFAGCTFAAKVAIFPALMLPHSIVVDETQVYIVDGAQIYIYSLKDYTFKKKFGKEGEGPQEFKLPHPLKLNIDVQTDHIVASSLAKVSFFTKDGKFKKEIRVPAGSGADIWFMPLGERFVGVLSPYEDGVLYRAINLYHSDLSRVKEIYRQIHELQPGKGTTVFSQVFHYFTYGNKLFVGGGEDLCIDVFDENGQKLYAVKHEYRRVKISEDTKNKVVDTLKTDPNTKAYFDLLKPIKFPEFYPALQFFMVDNNRIYAVTWKSRAGDVELLIFDIGGKFSRQVFVPLKYKSVLEPFPTAIHGGKLFQLIEDEDEEVWEVHVTAIE